MARKPLVPATGLATADVANNGKLYKAALIRIKPDGTIDQTSKSLGRLLLNPETWEESIDSNWVANQIPGQSNPIYQWVSGGPRVITFDALVTRDNSEFLKDKGQNDPLAAAIDTAINAVGDIASSFIGINVPPIADLFGAFGDNSEGENLGIHSYLNYYRSLLYPNYSAGRIDTSPPLIVLYAGKTFSSKNTTPADKIGANSDVWVVTSLKIRVTKQLPNLTPMEAVVTFRLNQYPFSSIGASHFDQSVSEDNITGGSLGSVIAGLF